MASACATPCPRVAMRPAGIGRKNCVLPCQAMVSVTSTTAVLGRKIEATGLKPKHI